MTDLAVASVWIADGWFVSLWGAEVEFVALIFKPISFLHCAMNVQLIPVPRRQSIIGDNKTLQLQPLSAHRD